MSNSFGKFVWYELMAENAPAAEAFYRNVVGWTSRGAGHDKMDYTAFLKDDLRIAGLLTMPAAAKARGARSFWIGYVAVDDVDSYTAKFKDAGGQIHRPPTDIPEIGRFSVVSDPQGATLVLFRPLPGMDQPMALPDVPGVFNWRELMASDGAEAFDFYSAMFGWKKDQAYDMGPFGTYQLFAAADGETIGGMMTKPHDPQNPYWTFYIHVDGLKAAVARLEAAGGKVVNGPNQVPGGNWVAQALDPENALFSIVSPNP